jgi:hypothetical protein
VRGGGGGGSSSRSMGWFGPDGLRARIGEMRATHCYAYDLHKKEVKEREVIDSRKKFPLISLAEREREAKGSSRTGTIKGGRMNDKV